MVYGFSTGGTGFFMQLCAVVNDQGQLKNSNLIDLEDRTKINSLTIESGEIVLDMLVHGPGDPAPFPTVRRISRYALKGDKLVETGMVLPRTGRGNTSMEVSKQAIYLRDLKGLAPFSPPKKFLAANFVTPEINPPFIFGTVKVFAARLNYRVDWLLEADEKNRYTYDDSPDQTGQYFVYQEEDRPDKVVYYVPEDDNLLLI